MTTPHTKGKSIVARRSANTERKVQQRKVSRKINSVNRILPEDSNVLHLEMQLVLIDEKAEEKIIKDDQSQEEIIIDEILSMSMDALLQTPKVPDRLLSPMMRRSRPLMSAVARPEEQISAQTSQQSGQLCSLHTYWSRSVQILCSDWLNLALLVPRSMPSQHDNML